MSETPGTIKRLETLKVMAPSDHGPSTVREVSCVYKDDLDRLERDLAAAEVVIDSAFDLIAKGADESAFAILRAYRGEKK